MSTSQAPSLVPGIWSHAINVRAQTAGGIEAGPQYMHI